MKKRTYLFSGSIEARQGSVISEAFANLHIAGFLSSVSFVKTDFCPSSRSRDQTIAKIHGCTKKSCASVRRLQFFFAVHSILLSSRGAWCNMSAAAQSFFRSSRVLLRTQKNVNPVQNAFGLQGGARYVGAVRHYAQVFDRTKPHVNIGTSPNIALMLCQIADPSLGTIGHVDHGKVLPSHDLTDAHGLI